ncbi:MAG: two-component regulator propeller domain-containing protein [Cyclobacteriaceae bacterium]
MKKISLLLILSLGFKVTLLTGQIPFFQQYHPLNKNQPVEVNALLQDSKGFVWFGTNKGVFRFDGIQYKRYADSDSLVNSHVTALAEDSLGRIWVGHQDGQLSYLENGKFHIFETREGLAVAPVSDILFDRKGNMWFSTKNDGLYYYLNDRLYRLDQEEGLPDLFIYDLFEDARGNVWAGTDGGVAICTLNDDRKVNITVLDSDDGLPDIIIKKIEQLHGDTLSLATEDEGILNYNINTRELRPLLNSPWPYGSISDFVVKENQIWISTPSKGLVVYDRRTNHLKLFNESSGLSLLSVNTLMMDSEGNVWSGSKTGLSRTSGDAVEHIESLDPAKDINILALAVDREDRIWFSTSEGLFMRTHHHNGTAIVTEKLQGTSFRNSTIISLYADDQGYIWAGLYGNGLLKVHPETNQIKHFNKELRNGNILGITGKGNIVWVATLGGSTSIHYDQGKYSITNYSSQDGLSSDFIYQVFIDSQGRTWFGTDGKGVTMLDEKGFHRYEEGLESKVVYSLSEDVNKNIWVTSQDNGVYHFDGVKFIAEPELRLRDNSIQSLIADVQGNLIAVHNFGIDVFDINRKKMRYWGEETGIRDKFPNLNAISKDKYGQVFIGTSKGIIKFSLNNDHALSIPKPTIDLVSIYDEAVDISKPLTLSYNENNVTVHYLGFWYQNSENLNYLYKLENYDLEWISTRNQEVTYSRLPPGDYVFKVKVSDTEDFTHAHESEITFSISPPFWRTGTFYFFIIGLVVVSGYSLMKFRERKLVEDKLVLEARVEERTKEIQQKTEEIQAQNEEIMAQAEEIQGINENLEMLVKQRTAELEKKNRALEEYAFINAHKLRSPVASILGLLNLLAKIDQKDDTKVIREHLQQSADKLDAVVRSITKAIEKADNKYS